MTVQPTPLYTASGTWLPVKEWKSTVNSNSYAPDSDSLPYALYADLPDDEKRPCAERWIRLYIPYRNISKHGKGTRVVGGLAFHVTKLRKNLSKQVLTGLVKSLKKYYPDITAAAATTAETLKAALESVPQQHLRYPRPLIDDNATFAQRLEHFQASRDAYVIAYGDGDQTPDEIWTLIHHWKICLYDWLGVTTYFPLVVQHAHRVLLLNQKKEEQLVDRLKERLSTVMAGDAAAAALIDQKERTLLDQRVDVTGDQALLTRIYDNKQPWIKKWLSDQDDDDDAALIYVRPDRFRVPSYYLHHQPYTIQSVLILQIYNSMLMELGAYLVTESLSSITKVQKIITTVLSSVPVQLLISPSDAAAAADNGEANTIRRALERILVEDIMARYNLKMSGKPKPKKREKEEDEKEDSDRKAKKMRLLDSEDPMARAMTQLAAMGSSSTGAKRRRVEEEEDKKSEEPSTKRPRVVPMERFLVCIGFTNSCHLEEGKCDVDCRPSPAFRDLFRMMFSTNPQGVVLSDHMWWHSSVNDPQILISYPFSVYTNTGTWYRPEKFNPTLQRMLLVVGVLAPTLAIASAKFNNYMIPLLTNAKLDWYEVDYADYQAYQGTDRDIPMFLEKAKSKESTEMKRMMGMFYANRQFMASIPRSDARFYGYSEEEYIFTFVHAATVQTFKDRHHPSTGGGHYHISSSSSSSPSSVAAPHVTIDLLNALQRKDYATVNTYLQYMKRDRELVCHVEWNRILMFLDKDVPYDIVYAFVVQWDRSNPTQIPSDVINHLMHYAIGVRSEDVATIVLTQRQSIPSNVSLLVQQSGLMTDPEGFYYFAS